MVATSFAAICTPSGHDVRHPILVRRVNDDGQQGSGGVGTDHLPPLDPSTPTTLTIALVEKELRRARKHFPGVVIVQAVHGKLFEAHIIERQLTDKRRH